MAFALRTHELTNAALPQALAQDIAERLEHAIAQRGQAVLMVSGGKSPIAMFEALRTCPLPWHKVTISLADERCVPNDHADSNALLVRTHLLKDRAQAAQLVPLMEDQASLASPSNLAAQATTRLLALGAADVLVLGMGTDGHTASLFPDAPNLPLAMDLGQSPACLHIDIPHPPPQAPYARITQNLSMLLTARHIALPVSGADKLAVLERAKTCTTLALPVAKVLQQHHTPVALWLAP